MTQTQPVTSLPDPTEFKTTRICSKCGIEKALTEFHKHKNGYLGVRPSCKTCRSAESKKYHNAHKEVMNKRHRIYKSANKDKIREQSKIYYEEHKKERKAYDKKHYELHKEEIKIYAKSRRQEIRTWYRKYQKERLLVDAKFKLNKNISRSINRSLKSNKDGRTWSNLVLFTINDLKKHIESLFADGMTWKNYGKWHIDHKTPISVFNFTQPEHRDFKRCWALKNLQPMWATDNMIKHDKITKPFQPSLLL